MNDGPEEHKELHMSLRRIVYRFLYIVDRILGSGDRLLGNLRSRTEAAWIPYLSNVPYVPRVGWYGTHT